MTSPTKILVFESELIKLDQLVAKQVFSTNEESEQFLKNGVIAAYIIALGRKENNLLETVMSETDLIRNLKTKNKWESMNSEALRQACQSMLIDKSVPKPQSVAKAPPVAKAEPLWTQAMNEVIRKITLPEHATEAQKIKCVESFLKDSIENWLNRDDELKSKSGINSIRRLDLSQEAEKLYYFFKETGDMNKDQIITLKADLYQIKKYVDGSIGRIAGEASGQVNIRNIFQQVTDKILLPVAREDETRRKRWAKFSITWPDAAKYYRSSLQIEKACGELSMKNLAAIEKFVSKEMRIQPQLIEEGIKAETIETLRAKFKEPTIQIYRSKVAEDLISGIDVRKGTTVFRWNKESRVTPGLDEDSPLVIEVQGNTYYVSKLKRTDPRGFYIGKETACCQYISGNAENCVLDGYSNPNAAFLVVKDSQNNLVAQCYSWLGRDKNELCLDSYEHNAEGRPIAQELLSKIGEGLIQRFRYTKVSVGTEGATEDAKITKDSFTAHNGDIDYVSYDGVPFYADSKKQYIIAKDTLLSEQFDLQLDRLLSTSIETITEEDKVFIASLLDTRKTKSLNRILEANNPHVLAALIQEMFSKDKLRVRLKDNDFYYENSVLKILFGDEKFVDCFKDQEVASIFQESFSDVIFNPGQSRIIVLNEELKTLISDVAFDADEPDALDQLKKAYEHYDQVCNLVLGSYRYVTYFQTFEELLAQQYFMNKTSKLGIYIDQLDEGEKNKIFTQNAFRYVTSESDVEFLMSRGLDINGKDSHKISPLYFLSLNSDENASNLIMKNATVSASFHELNDESLSVLLYLIFQENPAVTDYMMTHQAYNQFNPDEKNKLGTLLFYAFQKNDIKTIRSLIELGANLDPTINNTTTILQSLYLVSQVLDKNSNEAKEAKTLFQDLYNRVTSNQIIITEEEMKADPALKPMFQLLKFKHNINDQDKNKQTLLYQALINYDVNLVIDLVAKGVDITPGNNGFEKTWLQYLYEIACRAPDQADRNKAKNMVDCLVLNDLSMSSVPDDKERLALQKISGFTADLNEQNEKKRTLFYYAHKNDDWAFMNELISHQVKTDLAYNGITESLISSLIKQAKQSYRRIAQQEPLDNLFDALYGSHFSVAQSKYSEINKWFGSLETKAKKQCTQELYVLYSKLINDNYKIVDLPPLLEKFEVLVSQPDVDLSLKGNPGLDKSVIDLIFNQLNELYKASPVDFKIEERLLNILKQAVLRDKELANEIHPDYNTTITAELFNKCWARLNYHQMGRDTVKKFIEIIIDNGANLTRDYSNINLNHESNDSFLQAAWFISISRQLDLLDYLIDKGAPINEKMKFGRTFLTTLVDQEAPDVITKLFTHGLNYEQNYNHLEEPLIEWALKKLSSGSEYDIKKRPAYADMVKTYLTSLKDVNEKYNDSETTIYAVIRYGKVEHLDLLLSRDVNILLSNDEGKTPFEVALHQGRWDMVKRLLTHDPKLIDFCDEQGNTVLNLVIKHEKREADMVNYLLKLQPEQLMMMNRYYRTPLHLAAFYGDSDLVELLLDKGARDKTCYTNGKPSDIAARQDIANKIVAYESSHYRQKRAEDDSEMTMDAGPN